MSSSCWLSHPFLEVLIFFFLYVEGCNENVIERRTAEVSNFLDMLRSASSNVNDSSSKASETVHPEWKVCYAKMLFSLFLRYLIFFPTSPKFNLGRMSVTI